MEGEVEEEEKQNHTVQINVNKWFVPLNEEIVFGMMSESRVHENSFTIHPNYSNKNEFYITHKSEGQLDQILITCQPDICKYSIGNPNPILFNTLSEIVSNILTHRIKLRVDGNRDLVFKSYLKCPIPAKKWFICGRYGDDALQYFKTYAQNRFAVWLTNDGDFVLGIKTSNLKTMNIYSQKRGFTLDTTTFFSDIEQLINHYMKFSIITDNTEFNKPLPKAFECSSFFICMIGRRIEELLKPGDSESSKEQFYPEFSEIETRSKRNSFGFSDAQRPNSINKNRYKNILAYDHTRVKLQDCGDDDYINANFVEADFQSYPPAYILCQAPIEKTVDDHWRAIIQEKVKIIVILTNFVEKDIHKCVKYWNETGESLDVADKYTITTKVEETIRDIVHSTIVVKNNESDEEYEVFIMQFIAWPDFGVPKECWGILELLGHLNSHRERNPDTTVMVHCSAGIGRTGAFVLLDIMLNKLKSDGIKAVVDIKEMILKVRTQRALLVSTLDQYKFIHLTIMRYLEWRLGQSSFQICFKKL